MRRAEPRAQPSEGEGWDVAATKKADSKADAKKPAAPAKGAGKSGGKK